MLQSVSFYLDFDGFSASVVLNILTAGQCTNPSDEQVADGPWLSELMCFLFADMVISYYLRAAKCFTNRFLLRC